MELTGETFQLIGTGVGAFFIALGMWWGKSRSDGKPPAERQPSPHEFREALSDLRRLFENAREDNNDDHRHIVRQLDRIENRLRITDEVSHWNDRTLPPR